MTYQAMCLTSWSGAQANTWILTILGQAPTEPVAIAAFQRMATTLVEWWDADNNTRTGQTERNYKTEADLSELLQLFLFNARIDDATSIMTPIVDLVDSNNPAKAHQFLKGLIGVEDRTLRSERFWSLWKLFAEKVRRATWLGAIDNEHACGRGMISTIFLGMSWNDNVRHWRSLEGTRTT